MRTLLKVAGMAALSIACMVPVAARAAVVVLDDAQIQPMWDLPEVLTLTKSVDWGVFAVSIQQQGSDFRFAYAGIAELYRLFEATEGTLIDSTFAQQTTPIVGNDGIDPGSSLQSFALGESRYFAYWDDRNGGPLPDVQDNYGWVKLTRTADGLVASSSATAIGGSIQVGSVTAVPEAGALAMWSAGAALILAAAPLRRSRHTGDTARVH